MNEYDHGEQEQRSARILLIDDNPDAIELLTLFLKGKGFAVSSAFDAEGAFRKMRTAPPDLIITDYIMPRMSGLELCRQIRSDRALQDIPIIMHTASAMDPPRGTLYDKCIPKPVDLGHLLRTIDMLLAAQPGCTARQGGTSRSRSALPSSHPAFQ